MTARTPAQHVWRLAAALSVGGALLLVTAVLWHNWGDLWWPEPAAQHASRAGAPSEIGRAHV